MRTNFKKLLTKKNDMKNLQQCTHCLMVVSKDDNTCPSCGEAINLSQPEAASGCYEPYLNQKNKPLDITDIEKIAVTAIWFLIGFGIGLIF